MNATNVFKRKIAEIKDEYPLLENHGDLWALGIYDTICEEQILKEFISQTIDAYKTKKAFEKRFPALEIIFDIENPKTFRIESNKSDFKYWKDMLAFFDSFGWYPSYLALTDNFLGDIQKRGRYSDKLMDEIINSADADNNSIHVSLEAKYDTEQQPEGYYYHLVPDIYLNKVELKGLTPKTKSKMSTHPERIYLLNPGNEEEYGTIASMLHDKIPSEETKAQVKQYYLLRIDANALKDKVKFYNDPNFLIGNGAVWTYQNIAPKYIEKIEAIPV